MRVLFVSHDFLPAHAAGTEIYAGSLARELRARGHDVRVFTTEKDIARAHLSVVRRAWEGVPVYELTNNLFYEGFEETWDWPPAEEALARVLDEFQPDVVHVMHLLYLSVSCVELVHRRGIPVFYTLHDFWLMCARFGQRIHADGGVCHTIDFARCGTCLVSLKYAQTPTQRRMARWIAGIKRASGVDLKGPAQRVQDTLGSKNAGGPAFEEPDAAAAGEMERAARRREDELRRRLLPCVERFLAPSRFLRDRFLEWGVAPERIEYTAYGIDLTPFRGRVRVERPPGAPLRIGYIGTLAPHKAPHVLLEAWGRLTPEERALGRLTVHGPRQHYPAYVRRLEELARSVGADLAGGLPRARLGETLAATDLLCVTSIWYENSPLTIHEALAAGTPLAVSDLGGMAELVEPGRQGFRFRPGDAAELAALLRRLLRAPDELAQLDPGEPVKDIRTSAEEMEERYVEAVGRGEPR